MLFNAIEPERKRRANLDACPVEARKAELRFRYTFFLVVEAYACASVKVSAGYGPSSAGKKVRPPQDRARKVEIINQNHTP